MRPAESGNGRQCMKRATGAALWCPPRLGSSRQPRDGAACRKTFAVVVAFSKMLAPAKAKHSTAKIASTVTTHRPPISGLGRLRETHMLPPPMGESHGPNPAEPHPFPSFARRSRTDPGVGRKEAQAAATAALAESA